MFDDRESLGNVYPRDDYSGLNLLRARLKNRHWDGRSPLSNDSLSSKSEFANAIPNNDGSVINGFYVTGADSLLSSDMNNDSFSIYSHSDYLTFIGSRDECIGSPVYFFFELGTDQVTDKS